MAKLYRTFVLFFIHLIFIVPTSWADYPGVAPGSFTVTDAGAASYSLPITTPAGINGMSPNLAVTYSSNGDSGLMGVGVQLSGFSSSIHRCGGSHATDGQASSVTYTNFDKLCLDGQRLIVTKGTHFSEGAEYRTEIDTFSKVIYTDGKFLLYTRDGEITSYAWRVWASQKVARWLKNSEKDRNGNTIRYTYKHVSGEYWLPKEVTWNETGAPRKAVFTYTLRDDKRTTYEYGTKRQHKFLIEKVITYIDTLKIKEYQFIYETAPVSGLSRMTGIRQCGSDGVCFPKHQFEWKDAVKGFSGDTASYHLPVRIYDYQDQFEVVAQTGDFVDVNNDGRDDYVVSYKDSTNSQTHHAIYKNTGTRFQLVNGKTPPTEFVMRDYSIRKKNIQYGVYADVNGDGYPDIVRAYSFVYLSGWRTIRKEVWLNNRDFSWTKATNGFTPPSLLWSYAAGVGENPNTSSDNDQFNFRDPYKLVPMTKGHLIDVNGDGLVDWVQSYRNFQQKPRRNVWLNNGTDWVRATTTYQLPPDAFLDDYWEYNSVTSSVKPTRFEDINGDGLIDLVQSVRYFESPSRIERDLRQTWLNNGSGWSIDPNYAMPDTMLDYTRVGGNNASFYFSPQSKGNLIDINGDGLKDWVQSYIDHTDLQAHRATWFNNGKGWTPASADFNLPGDVIANYHPITGHKSGHPSGSFFDANRDGLVDWVVAYKYKDANNQVTTVRNTYRNTGAGWQLDNTLKFPDILIDRTIGWEKTAVQYGGIMDIDADGAVDYLMSSKNIFGANVVKTYLGKAKPADLLAKIINTMGADTLITYKPMNDPSVYSHLSSDSDYTLRKLKVNGATPLVSDTAQSNGIGYRHWLKYHYYRALFDSERGYSGFAQRRIWDKQQKTQTIKDFYQEFPSTGMTLREIVYKVDDITNNGSLGQNPELLNYKWYFLRYQSSQSAQGSVLNHDRIIHPNGNYTYSPKVKRTLNNEYELGQEFYRRTWTNINYDEYANPTHVKTAVIPYNVSYESINWDNSFYKRSVTTYKNDTANWLIGLPEIVTVNHYAPGQASADTRVAETVYDAKGQPRFVIIEPNISTYRITTENKFNSKGNQYETIVSGLGPNGNISRISKVGYEPSGMHVTSRTNPENHEMKIVPDPRCDAAKSTTDANGLVTQITYDGHCRVKTTVYPDGTTSSITYPGTNNLRTVVKTTNQPDVITYYDILGRVIKTQTKGYSWRNIFIEKKYNSKGKITQESLPYYNGDAKYWSKYAYDAIGRLEKTTGPDNSVSTIDYGGLTTITTNPKGQTQTKTTDLLGRVISILDAEGEELTYKYDAIGNLRETTDSAGNKVTMDYDRAGNKVWMDDPDMGKWKYDYDAFGQLIEQTDANDNVITSAYDNLGRLEKRTTAEGTSTWEYDTAQMGVGKLSITMNASSYKREHHYDQYSRPSYTSETVQNVLTESRNVYNANGKLEAIYYPGRDEAIRFEYHNQLGYLTKVLDEEDNVELWVLDDMDAKGNVTQEHYSNGVNITRNYHDTRGYLTSIESKLAPTTVQDLGYVMDSIGNLTSRSNGVTGTTETFRYDDLNRLRFNNHTPGLSTGLPEVEYEYRYDDIGNMTFRSDLGNLYYQGSRPHAVSSVMETTGATIAEHVYNPLGNYVYDANGNLLLNGPRKISWTTFNKPKKMETTINGLRKVFYFYGSDFQRIRKWDDVKRKTTRYFGSGSVERISGGGTTHWKYYIPVGAATLELKYNQTGTNSSPTMTQIENQFLFKDHLGSTDVIVDNAGVILERLSFNPWGERRNGDWGEATAEITSTSTRGFTGHEMDDEIGVVNMNARIYDPVIGRFLSPDALISDPSDMQSYNRYSYVNNNPLSFTDPTGHKKEHVPGKGGYYVENGTFYQRVQYIKGYNGKDNEVYGYRYVKVTDPGTIRHLRIRLGVVDEIVKNYGGISRGNTKETRNNYNNLAAQELASNGRTDLYQSYLDRGYAAHMVYRMLKDQKRMGYAGMATKLVASAMAGGVVAGLESAVAQAVGSGLSSVAMSGGDLKAGLVAAATAGLGGTLHSITDLNSVAGIAAHGVVGGVASEIQGGGFAEGFVGNAVGKAITVGTSDLFNAPPGTFHVGQLGLTVGGAAIAAELAGGDGAMAGLQAAIGYATNHGVATSRDERIRHQKSHQGGYLGDGGGSGGDVLFALGTAADVAMLFHPAGALRYTAVSLGSAYLSGNQNTQAASVMGAGTSAVLNGYFKVPQAWANRIGAATSILGQ